MDLMKNMEAVLMLGFGVMCAAAFSAGPLAPAHRAGATAAPEAPVQVIVVTGKRLTAAEKRALA